MKTVQALRFHCFVHCRKSACLGSTGAPIPTFRGFMELLKEIVLLFVK